MTLAYLHEFTYSERPETPAPRLGEEVPVEERKRRSSLLRELGLELRSRFLGKLEGTVQEVLPEGLSGPDHWQGLTDNYVRVRFPWTGDSPENRIYRVRLQDAGSPVSGILIEDRPSTETRLSIEARPSTEPRLSTGARASIEDRPSTEAHPVSSLAPEGSNAWSGSRRAKSPENVPT
jgi:hypothetical protein